MDPTAMTKISLSRASLIVALIALLALSAAACGGATKGSDGGAPSDGAIDAASGDAATGDAVGDRTPTDGNDAGDGDATIDATIDGALGEAGVGDSALPLDVHAYAVAFCAYARACLADEFYGYGQDADGCVAALVSGATGYLEEPGLDVAAAVANLDACLAALDAVACNDSILPSCNYVGPGTLPLGAKCEGGEDCVSGQCVGVGPPLCATCGAPFAGVGAACGSETECTNGTFCASGTCAPLGVAGAACATNDQCVSDEYCGAGKCTPYPKLGAACDGTTVPCPLRTQCDATAHTCQPFGAVGAACTSTTGCDVARGTTCDATTSKCVAMPVVPVALGATCPLSMDPTTPGTPAPTQFTPCPDRAACIATVSGATTGTCMPVAYLGDACGTGLAQCGPVDQLMCGATGTCVATTVCP
jgi:hypothetical protein